MNRHEFTPLGDLLPKVVNQYNLKRQVSGALVCHHFRTLVKTLWPEGAERFVQPQSYKEGVLKIAVSDSGWAQQIQFKQVAILEGLARTCSKQPIRRLQTRVEPELFDKFA